MASLDVAARLDEGQAAVDTIAEYVWACHLLGFSHPDLTRYRYQVHDGYAAEEGLDLRTLEAESASLAAAATAAEQAARLQDNQFRNLTQAWRGAGARASTDFLGRHATSSAQVVSGIDAAAATLARLRDQLWDAVDAKVTAVLQIEARQAGRRDAWLAAARTVSTGMGDRSAASELIDTQVKPFVVNDIGGDWVMAMRGTSRAVADAYARAVTALRTEGSPVFGIPGDLGPVWLPSTPESRHPAVALAADTADRASDAGASGGFTAAPASAPSFAAPPVAGMAAGAPVGAPGFGAGSIVPAGAPGESAAPASASPTGWGQGLGGGGLPGLGGLPDIGSGLAGSGQPLADLLGGLIGSSAGDLPEDFGDLTDEGVDDIDPGADDEAHDEAENDEEADEAAADEGETDEGETDDGAGEQPAEVTEPQPDSPPVATEVPEALGAPPAVPEPPAEPLAEPLAAPADETPCEIAADELPQAGP